MNESVQTGMTAIPDHDAVRYTGSIYFAANYFVQFIIRIPELVEMTI